MPTVAVTTSFEHINETLDVRIDIGVRVLDGIANARLSREMHNRPKFKLREQRFRRDAIGKVELQETEAGIAAEDFEARSLQCRIVVVIDNVDANDLPSAFQQSLHDMKTDEAGRAGDKHFFVLHLSLH